MSVTHSLLDLHDLLDPTLMSSAGKRRFKPGFQYLSRRRLLGLCPAENQNIGIIVLAAGSRPIEIKYQSGTNSGKLIGDNGHAYAARTDQYSPLSFALRNPKRNFAAKIRVVHRLSPMGAKVAYIHIFGAQQAYQIVLEFHSTVVATDRYHTWAARDRSRLDLT